MWQPPPTADESRGKRGAPERNKKGERETEKKRRKGAQWNCCVEEREESEVESRWSRVGSWISPESVGELQRVVEPERGRQPGRRQRHGWSPAECGQGHRGTPNPNPSSRLQGKVASTASRSSCGLHSSMNYKDPRGLVLPLAFPGVSLYDRCGAMSLSRTVDK